MAFPNGPMEGPRNPTSSEYPALLKFLSKSYGFSDPRWFENDTPIFFGPGRDRLATKWLLKSGSRIASHVGIFPFTALVGSARLKVAGIGSVATDPEFRGRGLMKRLMDHSLRDMERAGFDLSILWGERGLYGQFGYERALFQDRFNFTDRTLKYSVVPKGARPAGEKNWPALQKLFKSHPFRIERSPLYIRSLNRRFSRDWSDPIWVLEEKGKVRAYIIILKTASGAMEVAEWGGEVEDLVCLMATALHKKGLDWLTLSVYPGCDLYKWAFENNDNLEKNTAACMVRVFKLGKILKAFEGQLRARSRKMPLKGERSVALRLETEEGAVLRWGKDLQVLPYGKADQMLTLSSHEITTLLFGCGRPSDLLGERLSGLEWLDALFPLDWYWWRSDWV